MNPEEAVMVHLDLKAKYSIGVHWGTFLMSDEHYLDPPKEFEKARLGHAIEKSRVFTSTFGKTIILESDSTSPNSTQSLNTAESYMTYSLQSLNTISDSHQSSHPSDNMTQSMTIDSNQSEI